MTTVLESLLQELVGGTIEKVFQDKDDYYCLVVNKNGKRLAVWFMRDDEMNGPGCPAVDDYVEGEYDDCC